MNVPSPPTLYRDRRSSEAPSGAILSITAAKKNGCDFLVVAPHGFYAHLYERTIARNCYRSDDPGSFNQLLTEGLFRIEPSSLQCLRKERRAPDSDLSPDPINPYK
jgi:hypothetical protein